MQKTVSRSVSSDKSPKGSFDGDVVVINPVKYNPFIEYDDVEVKTWRDDK